ncbi:MAG: primosomal protein N' [Eubacteriales bacterium]
MDGNRFAQVIVDVNHSSVDRIFDYRIPESMAVNVGQKVSVPFSKSKNLSGIVIGLTDKSLVPKEKIKDIISVLDAPVMTLKQIKLSKEIAKRYHTTLASAMRLFVPTPLRRGKVKEKSCMVFFVEKKLSESERKEIFYFKSGKEKSPVKLAVYNEILDSGKDGIKAGDLNESKRAAAAALLKQGIILYKKEEVFRRPGEIKKDFEDVILTAEQMDVSVKIANKIGTYYKFLLHGVTGSGKTEVYLQAVKEALLKDKGIIILVPEISLTPQMVMMFKKRILSPVAILHSKLSDGEKHDELKRIMSGEARVVIGARSAVFAPVSNLGLIIIDEEHEQSYISDSHPRYDTREIADMRAKLESACVVLASATPSIESYFDAQNGKSELIKLKNRVFNVPLPKVLVADMRDEIRKGNMTMFSSLMYKEIKEALQNSRQVMIFINRRGYSTFVMCRGCGYIEKCDNCDISLTYHKSENSLKCHYCGAKRPVKKICPNCNMPYLKYFGGGTEKIVEQLSKLFPNARIMRMDLDSMMKKDAYLKAYSDFADGKADILVGTQIIAKGLDFENVSLTGIISADLSLNFPDYKSAERTYQILEQVSGRAGRRQQGKCVIQTYTPEHYAVKCAQSHDYSCFYLEELKYRKTALLPPFISFLSVKFESKKEGKASYAAKDFYKALLPMLDDYKDKIVFKGEGPAGVVKIKGVFRHQVLLKVKRESLDDVIEVIKTLSFNKNYTDCVYEIMVNPKNML